MEDKNVNTNNFATYDIQIAAVLVSLGYKLVSLDHANPKRILFCFKSDPGIEKTIESYWDGSLFVPAQRILTAYKELKGRLYAAC
jgi:hypothetical protein